MSDTNNTGANDGGTNNVRPGDDFFQYVNGKWIAENPIPPTEAQWGSFYILRVQVEEQSRTLLDELKDKEVVSGSDDQKVRDFYRAAMDIDRRNQLGVKPLADIFAKIDAVVEQGLFGDSLVRAVGFLHRLGINPFWATFAGQDEKQSDVIALQFYQGGLGLPDRDYYLNDDEKSKKIREDYVLYMKDMLARAGVVENAGLVRAADTILAIESRLAKASLTRAELRDVEKMYNKVTLAAFATLAPKIDLVEYFKEIAPWSGSAGAAVFAPKYLIVGQPKFFTEVNEIFEAVPLEDLKLYMKWHAVKEMASYLTEEFERRTFDFYGRTFNGATEMKSLWRRALAVTNLVMDELVGKLYVARYFSEDAKQKIKDLVEHLSVAYRARIEKLDWMGAATKQKAIEKLGAISKKLGYPDVWKDYSGLTVDPAASFAENLLRASTFEFDRKMKEVGGPVNREEWHSSPQTVNAFCDFAMNEILFPAGILQPPFFDPAGDFAANFGAMGSTIGHEFTHAFDDQGSRFDLHGNLNDWWTAEDKAHFAAKAAQLAEQFNKYELFPGAFVNGNLTLGENIADLGGLVIAYDAMKLAIAENPALAAPIHGKTPEQRFFIACAVFERAHYREERARYFLQIDPHAPAQFRINGPVSNAVEFYEAFGLKEGDKLWRKPEDRVKIW